MQESGVLVIDKWRHFVSLLVITRLNGPDRDDRDGNKGVYSFFYGDKETFWLGFELAGDTDYNFHQGDAGAMGVIKDIDKFVTSESLAAKPPPPPLDPPIVEIAKAPGSNHDGPSGGEAPALEVKESTDASRDEADRETRRTGLLSEAHDKASQASDESQMDSMHTIIEKLHDSMSDDPDKATDDEIHRISRREYPQVVTETISAQNLTMKEMNSLEGANFTMWSSQLLHLDLEGRPLWFNGWIQESKWNHDKNVPLAKFEYFLKERRQPVQQSVPQDADGDIGEVDSGKMAEWATHNENMAMLRSDRVYDFTEDERDTLDMIVGIARGFGAVA